MSASLQGMQDSTMASGSGLSVHNGFATPAFEQLTHLQACNANFAAALWYTLDKLVQHLTYASPDTDGEELVCTHACSFDDKLQLQLLSQGLADTVHDHPFVLLVAFGCICFVCKMGARQVIDNVRVAFDMSLVIVATHTGHFKTCEALPCQVGLPLLSSRVQNVLA